VLYELPISPKEFIPSVLNPKLIFLTTAEKSLYFRSKFLHWIPSSGWWNIASFLCSLTCHCNNSAFSLLTNNHCKREIMGKYHVTLASTLLTFLFSPMSSSSIFLSFHLYRDVLQTWYYSNMASSLWNSMQSFRHAWIFSISNPNGQTIFLAWYVLRGNTLAFGSKSFKNYNN
jgi:hypothetical protein